ncbi:unnamed protein product, partial [Closterium sp. NIES-65]
IGPLLSSIDPPHFHLPSAIHLTARSAGALALPRPLPRPQPRPRRPRCPAGGCVCSVWGGGVSRSAGALALPSPLPRPQPRPCCPRCPAGGLDACRCAGVLA